MYIYIYIYMYVCVYIYIYISQAADDVPRIFWLHRMSENQTCPQIYVLSVFFFRTFGWADAAAAAGAGEGSDAGTGAGAGTDADAGADSSAGRDSDPLTPSVARMRRLSSSSGSLS